MLNKVPIFLSRSMMSLWSEVLNERKTGQSETPLIWTMNRGRRWSNSPFSGFDTLTLPLIRWTRSRWRRSWAMWTLAKRQVFAMGNQFTRWSNKLNCRKAQSCSLEDRGTVIGDSLSSPPSSPMSRMTWRSAGELSSSAIDWRKKVSKHGGGNWDVFYLLERRSLAQCSLSKKWRTWRRPSREPTRTTMDLLQQSSLRWEATSILENVWKLKRGD